MRFFKPILVSLLLSLISTISVGATPTLIGTYNVNYRFNAAGCFSNGDFGPTQGNPYFCPSPFPPGPIFIDAPPGEYQIVDTTVSHMAIWSGDQVSGTRYEPGGGTVNFALTHGQIVLYYWDWFVSDNSPDDFTIVEVYSLDSVPEPSTFICTTTAFLAMGILVRRLRTQSPAGKPTARLAPGQP